MFHEDYQILKKYYLKKYFNYIILILIQSTDFDTANAVKRNLAFVLIIGAVEYEMIYCFYF